MKIVMFTNTYLPHVGGVANSVSTYEQEFRRRGHDVRIIAPQYPGAEESTEFVLRVPAIQKFNGSDFSVRLPQPLMISEYLDEFRPDIIHSHHPFLLGDSALRDAHTLELPIVFTYHTMYERYTHYVPLDSDAMKRVAIQMATEYCNLCSHIIAPSQSIADLLTDRGVTSSITAIPTGIDLDFFGTGDGSAFRRKHKIAQDALVIGHVGRLALEKNLQYLADAVALFLKEHPDARWLVVGSGDASDTIKATVASKANANQLITTGSLSGKALIDAYAAMDLFVFSSQSETQGMVLAEAMAASTAVLALDATGVRDILNNVNGKMLPSDTTADVFAQEIAVMTRDRSTLTAMGTAARTDVQRVGTGVCADRILHLYQHLIDDFESKNPITPDLWDRLLNRLEIEWNLLVEKSTALAAALVDTDATRHKLD